MPANKPLRNRFAHNKTIKDSKGISPTISTIIISGTLLIILVIASFVSANVLELQIASTEFEQAKTNMMLLDEVIQDVALRRGSGGYVQFNQRRGGIGITEHTEKIKIIGPGQPTVVTNSPTATSGTWNSPEGACADGGAYASIQSAKPSASQIYSGYGFDIPSEATIENVKVKYDAWTVNNEQIRVDVSWDGGNSWSLKQVTDLITSEQTYWYDVTAATDWTLAKLGDSNFRVRVDAYTVGSASEVRLDWIPVEVTYVPPASIIYESPPLISLVYRGGSYVSGSDVTLRGNDSLIVDMTSALSHLRVETGQGIQIKLDYHRVRIVETGTLVVGGELHNFIEITFLQLERGNMGGSGTVNVKVQNVGINTNTTTYESGSITIQVQLGERLSDPVPFPSEAESTVVMLTIVLVRISTA